MIGPALLDPMPVHATLTPIGAHTFRLESKDGYSSHGEPVVFQIDGAGRVARVTIGAERVASGGRVVNRRPSPTRPADRRISPAS